MTTISVVPTALARCCRDWVVPAYRWGRCGACGVKPEFVEMLPEDKWVYANRCVPS